MEIKKKRKVRDFFKRFGVYIGAIVLVLALTITGLAIGLTSKQGILPDDEVDVGTTPLAFSLPMTSPDVLKEFSNTELQENVTLGWWEAHYSMDLTSADGIVYSVLGGEVIDVGYTYAYGYTVTIKHDGGFVSTYASLDEQVLVSLHDKVTAGQRIGSVSTSASDEQDQDAHLHFTLYKDNKKVDPNNYIEFEKK